MNRAAESRQGQVPPPSADPWAGVAGCLADLLEVCQQEQEALVRLDGETVSSLSPRKQALLTALNQASARVPASMAKTPPPGLREMAQRCHRMNSLNRRLLLLTVNRMQALLKKLASASGDPRYGQASVRLLPGRIDSRV